MTGYGASAHADSGFKGGMVELTADTPALDARLGGVSSPIAE